MNERQIKIPAPEKRREGVTKKEQVTAEKTCLHKTRYAGLFFTVHCRDAGIDFYDLDIVHPFDMARTGYLVI